MNKSKRKICANLRNLRIKILNPRLSASIGGYYLRAFFVLRSLDEGWMRESNLLLNSGSWILDSLLQKWLCFLVSTMTIYPQIHCKALPNKHLTLTPSSVKMALFGKKTIMSASGFGHGTILLNEGIPVMNRLVKYFIKGLLFLIPVAVTVYVIIWVFRAIDGGMRQLIMGADDAGDAGDWWVKGLGIVILLVGITVVGFLSSLFITRPLVRLIEKLFSRLPLIKLLYSSIKDLIDIRLLFEKDDTEEVLSKFVLEGYNPHPAIKFKVAV